MQKDLISVGEAAKRLAVIPQRVRVLIADGRLPAQRVGSRYVLDAADVERFAREPRVRGRPLNAANAWALLAVVAGLPNNGSLGERPLRSRGRIESLLEQGAQAVTLALLRSQPRAAFHVWRILPSDADRLLDDSRIVKSGLCAGARGINVRYDPRRDGIDGYVARSDLADLEREFQPIKHSADANVLLRVPEGAEWVLGESVAPLAVVAIDLLSHDDPRVVRAGREALERLIH